MTGKQARWPSLQTGADYRLVLQGRSTLCLRSPCIDIYFSRRIAVQSELPAPASIPSRLGLIVSKRCYPRAVDRNRAKRIFREYARCSLRRDVNFDMVFRMKQPFSPLTLNAVSEVLNHLVGQAYARAGI